MVRGELIELGLSTLWESSKRYKSDKGAKFSTYAVTHIKRVLHRACLNEWKYRRRYRQYNNTLDEIYDRRKSHLEFDTDILDKALETCTPDQRIALIIWSNGTRVTCIANQLGVTKQAIDDRFNRGIHHLRKSIFEPRDRHIRFQNGE